jgi:4,5-dihydroxyphthalate decarboxylase
MSKLRLSVAIGDYDRNRPLIDGAVQIDAVDPVIMTLSPEEIFFRAIRHEAFDICELSLSSFTLRTARGDCPYVGVPAFVSRAFRHNAIIVRRDAGISSPRDLAGKRIGTPEWQLTANVWVRGMLEEHYGVPASAIHWVRGGIEEAGRVEKLTFAPPSGVEISDIPEDRTLSDMLLRGEIDGFIGPRAPLAFSGGDPRLRWLFDDPAAEAEGYFQRTRIFPIMHLIGIRKSLAQAHPWLPMAALKAFESSKAIALERLTDTSAAKTTLPFVDERLAAARRLMGRDFWPYGLAANRQTLATFLRYHANQGISSRILDPEELFHPGTHESHKI